MEAMMCTRLRCLQQVHSKSFSGQNQFANLTPWARLQAHESTHHSSHATVVHVCKFSFMIDFAPCLQLKLGP